MTTRSDRARAAIVTFVAMVSAIPILAACTAPTVSHRGSVHVAPEGSAPPSPPSSGRPTRTTNPVASRPRIVYFKVSRRPRCEVIGGATTQAVAPIAIDLSWKVTGADRVAFSDDEPDYFDSHGQRAGKRGAFPTTYTETLEFPCNDDGDTTHQYTMGNGRSQKMTITFTLPAAAPQW